MAILSMLATVGFIQVSRARITAREAIALSNLRTTSKACQMFFAINGIYPPNLDTLGPTISSPPYLMGSLTLAPYTKQGYLFTYQQQAAGSGFILDAQPTSWGSTGIRSFRTTQSGVIWYTDQNRPADQPGDLIL